MWKTHLLLQVEQAEGAQFNLDFCARLIVARGDNRFQFCDALANAVGNSAI